ILTLVGEHHNKDYKGKYKDLVNIVKLADWLSSGERVEAKDKDEVLKKEYQGLLSIFEVIGYLKGNSLEENIKILNNIYDKGDKYRIEPLNLNEIKKYPSPNLDYKSQLKGFVNEILKFKNIYFEELLQLLQKYLWCVPSATYWKDWKKDDVSGYLPDVSLYDHLRTTCAIASCLYKLYKDGKVSSEDLERYLKLLNRKDKNKLKEIKLFSLIHGDLSGIQDFIFTISSKYAAKTLKGRSFYLEFIMEYFAKYICNELELPSANIIYCGGGHFYILAYKIDDNKIEKFEEKINEKLYSMFKSKIYLTIVKEDVSLEDFFKFSDVWDRVSDKIVERKLQKFKGLNIFKKEEDKVVDEFFKCDICGYVVDEFILELNLKYCKNCESFKILTEYLKNCQSREKLNINNLLKIPIIKKLEDEFGVIKKPNSEFLRYYLDEYNLPENGKLEVPYKLLPLAFPIIEEDGKTRIIEFSELGEKAEERTGTNKIAILKMDIDYLGLIFTLELGELASISRISTLSSMLNLFFVGYLPHLIKTGTFGEEYYRDNVYLIYAGGDDTLIVGSWDAVWSLAKEIREKFKKYTCYNPNLNLSAGISIVNPKFEFKRSVEIADEELERSKGNNLGIEVDSLTNPFEKNSLSIFGCPMNWDLEVKYNKDSLEKTKEIYPNISSLEGIIKEYNEDNLEKNFLKAVDSLNQRRILHIAQIVGNKLERALDRDKDEVRLNFPYYWRALYYLHRNFKKGKGLKEEVKFLENYIKDKVRRVFLNNIKLSFNDLKVAAKITELKTKR
ncbi:type III-A CRISPR-associated protein Cas10/Csm1, partial [Methanocaldococcus infernus]